MVDHFISPFYAGGALSLSIPVYLRAVTEDAAGGFLCCLKKPIALFLEFLTCFG
jgi:hypothetical protein